MSFLTGFHAIEEALKSAGRGKGTLYVSGKGPRIKKIEELAARRGVPLVRLSAPELRELSSSEHRGIALSIEGYTPESSFEGFIESIGDNQTSLLVLLLDGITDPHNFGAILRSADQFEADFVCIPERRAASETEVVANSSAGAVHHVPFAQVPNLSRAVEKLKKHGFWVYGAAMGGDPIHSVDLTGRIAIVLGSEGRGISANLATHCDAEVAVPTRGRLDSLNVSVAAGIILYEIRRQQAW
ncbi:23S rRNA (guanosine(2251)-2'-O)-methyltransferase RlmB [Marispirochaeta aestuarii]|uniref:23S rRNA (Guanosine(2251)-2'-O)-methyltransferase RlmB n=1 Tax=Marispirochaeta aestuarii TaxID=1963862 RepID=A0A1Y1S3Z0_9SPIO|nr:23S rRNA (guanosine(2251)-2'-O)-methyltransferase RlmB [Marispirochaeta aestuarii]ORC38254.1 23S rRNA (guanosine(2251)-2'-O)-methyltransferase RlmB [Marispirochaeta aestuarii]